MIAWIEDKLEWIVAGLAGLAGLVIYGWWREQQGAAKARAKSKVKKAEREEQRAEKLMERGDEQEALEEADRLLQRVRERHEKAAHDLEMTDEEVSELSDSELRAALGDRLGG